MRFRFLELDAGLQYFASTIRRRAYELDYWLPQELGRDAWLFAVARRWARDPLARGILWQEFQPRERLRRQ